MAASGSGGAPLRRRADYGEILNMVELWQLEPIANLLHRLAETGGGKILNPANPVENPFEHDRQKTFQPRDLWEWLLKLAVVLFPLDVGIRRIYLDRAEWLKATRSLRRRIFFWRGVPRAPEADESLSALLARRDQVRARQTTPVVQPSPELFKPEKEAVLPSGGGAVAPARVEGRAADETAPAPTPDEPVSTASRLLAAKKKARQRGER
jgi:hypothetical protein